MNSLEIETILNDLKSDSLGRIRNKSKVTDKLRSAHLKELDSVLMDVRVFVDTLSKTSFSEDEVLNRIDEFLYQKQTIKSKP